ncbi:pyridoxine/pyridoxamine 5'-phosphate oxidase [Methanococcus voltae]|uniref:Pyridoxine/pyridoxamine 5'-phosphate oxidase n=2 Tax=Methanococcus voltae TaxID=2188 RepID=A0A8J7RGE4_METVO|nr:pyridoxine/pyridoxamine 5'-phosphate oxidase [Methanococcus voltae]MBP2201382.1 pyridoxine/pyridoxamine 5'-phosphate oxidase [Methanococcus voltae]MCS3922177.1 pyridoxine/pyridoxamine 5'-phosphate oxidase [Methanococcus voltae PS]
MTMFIYLQYHLKQNEKIIFIKNLDKIGYILYTNLKITQILYNDYINFTLFYQISKKNYYFDVIQRNFKKNLQNILT